MIAFLVYLKDRFKQPGPHLIISDLDNIDRWVVRAVELVGTKIRQLTCGIAGPSAY